jgi:hypothetical protein
MTRPPAASFSLELRLLFACCSMEDGKRQNIPPLLAAQPDWRETCDLAEHHNVIPLLCRSLLDFAELVPAPVLADLRRRYEDNARNGLRFVAELSRILECLEQCGVAAVPFKGPVLAETVYGDVGLRSFSDLDVLVLAADVPRAKAALASLGYSPSSPLSDAEERAYMDSGYEYVFDGPAGRNLLEIQWRILPRFYAIDFEFGGFFQRASQATLGDRVVKTLCREDLLLVLAVHAAKHGWARLIWLRDIAGLVHDHSLDFGWVDRQAKALGIERIVAVSLLLASRLLAVTLPAGWDRKLHADREISALSDEAERHLPTAEEYSTESLQYFRWMMRLRERRRDRWKLLSRLALTPGVGEWSLVKLPEPLFPLYRVIRVLRVAGRIVSAAAKE